MLTVADLPESKPSRQMKHRGRVITVEARQAHLTCPNCLERYSANPGDYFWMTPTDTFTCMHCDEPLELVR